MCTAASGWLLLGNESAATCSFQAQAGAGTDFITASRHASHADSHYELTAPFYSHRWGQAVLRNFQVGSGLVASGGWGVDVYMYEG